MDPKLLIFFCIWQTLIQVGGSIFMSGGSLTANMCMFDGSSATVSIHNVDIYICSASELIGIVDLHLADVTL